MKRPAISVGVAAVGLSIFIFYCVRSAWLRQVAGGPFQLLWDSSQQLNSSLLDASETGPVLSAGQRLLQPLGRLQLIRILSVPADQIHSHRSPAEKKDAVPKP